MTTNYLLLSPYFLALFISIGVTAYVFMHRSAKGAFTFLIFSISATVYVAGFLLETFAPTLSGKLFWDDVQWLPTLIIPGTYLYSIIEFAGSIQKNKIKTVVQIFAFPAIFGVLIILDPWLKLIRPSTGLLQENGVTSLYYPFTAVMYLFAAYTFIVWMYGLVILIRAFRNGTKPHQRPQLLVLLAGLLTLIAGAVLIMLQLVPAYLRDINPLSMGVANLILAVGIYRTRLFNVIPIARELIVENMETSIIVLDAQNCIIDMNISALTLLNKTTRDILGARIEDVFAGYPQLLEKYIQHDTIKDIIRVDVNGTTLYFDLSIKPIHRKPNKLAGRLVALQDITERKRSENELDLYRNHLEELVEKRTNELRQRADQMSALYDIGLTITSNLDLNQILHNLFKKCERLFPLDSFYIAVYDAPTGILRHPLYYDRSEKNFIQVSDRNIKTAPGLSGHVISSRETLYLRDLSNPEIQEKYKSVEVGANPMRSYVGVPMEYHGTVIGVISMQKFEVDAYAPEQIRLLETIATQAAVAIENARLFGAERKRIQEMETLRDVTGILTSFLELDKLFENIFTLLSKLISYNSVSIEIIEEGYLKIVAGQNIPQDLIGEKYKFNPEKWRDLYTLRRPVIIADVQNDERFVKFEQTKYIHSWMGIPLFVNDNVIGFLNFDSRTPNFFKEEHTAIAQTFANQAAIAIENARLFEAERLALEQSETLRESAAIVATTLDQSEAVEQILIQLKRVVPYDSASVQLVNGNYLEIVGGQGLPPSLDLHTLFPIDEQEPSNPILNGLAPYILFDNIQNSVTKFIDFPHNNILAWLAIPLKVKGKIIGIITLDGYQSNKFSERHAQLAVTYASQVAITLENARLFQVEQEGRREAETLQRSLASIVTTFDLEEVVERILDQIKLVIPYDTASVWRVDGDWLTAFVTRDLPPEVPLRIRLNDENSGTLLLRGEVPFILNNNVQEELRDFGGPHSYINSWLTVPLKKRDKIIGQIGLDGRRKNQFSAHHAELAVVFANQVAIALENASLYTEIQQELTERTKAQKALQQRDAISQAVARAAQAFLQSSNWRESIVNILEEFGKVMGISHSYIFENHILPDGTEVTSQKYEWSAPNIKPDIDNPKYQNIPVYEADVEDWIIQLRDGKPYTGNMDTFPTQEAMHFQELGIKSILDIPIFVDGKWWGNIGFDDMENVRVWNPSEIEILEIAAKMIGAAIDRERINEAIRSNENRYRELFEQSQDGIAIMSLDRKLLNKNKKIDEMMGENSVLGEEAVTNVSPLDQGDTKVHFERVVSGGKMPIYEQTFIRADGTSFVAEINLTLVKDSSGNPWYVQSIVRDITLRKRAEESLRASEEKYRELNISLEKRVVERTEQLQTEKAKIERIASEVATLRRLSDFLQSSETIEEAGDVIAKHMNTLFQTTGGALYLADSNSADLSAAATWGNAKLEAMIQPNECWGMRRGRVHYSRHNDASPFCSHFKDQHIESICLPLLAQGETIGLICLYMRDQDGNPHFTEEAQNLAVASADSISLALANLRLRERLRNQSIRDPLTGLYNRRFLEESLAREVQRASRSQQPLCVVMFEIDDFKQYNNTFGHEAGDYVLKKVADTMRLKLRKSDFPCRYGGDEFTFILPDTELENGAKCAEEIRKSVEAMALTFNNQALGVVTVRMGVAAYPRHGETGDAVLQVADAASYKARSIGKNCVVIAE